MEEKYVLPFCSGEGLTICRAKAVPSSLGYSETLKIGPAPGFEPATSLLAV